MRVGLIEAPDNLIAGSREWDQLATSIRAAAPDLLVTNEMPFGPWLAESDRFDEHAARQSVRLHEDGLAALRALDVPAVLSSRPVCVGNRLANEAFAVTDGIYHAAHHKHYFPAEGGFHETTWFARERPGFDVLTTSAVRVGFLLCTELFFNEWARHYRRAGAQIIAVPRASGEVMGQWHTAASMAAIVSGSYVVSSNRAGRTAGGQIFGGQGFAFAPDGTLLTATSPDQPVATFELDVEWVRRRRTEYPCYVDEIG